MNDERKQGGDFPFFRGDEVTGYCDFMLSDDDCCDAQAKYLVRWKIERADLGKQQFSGVCTPHATRVDRNRAEAMFSAVSP